MKRQRRLVALLFALTALCTLCGCARPMDEQLRQAALSGKTDEVTQLLGQGADPGYQYAGWTVLLFATRDGHVEIGRTLLERGAKVDAVAPRGSRPSWWPPSAVMSRSSRRSSPGAPSSMPG